MFSRRSCSNPSAACVCLHVYGLVRSWHWPSNGPQEQRTGHWVPCRTQGIHRVMFRQWPISVLLWHSHISPRGWGCFLVTEAASKAAAQTVRAGEAPEHLCPWRHCDLGTPLRHRGCLASPRGHSFTTGLLNATRTVLVSIAKASRAQRGLVIASLLSPLTPTCVMSKVEINPPLASDRAKVTVVTARQKEGLSLLLA